MISSIQNILSSPVIIPIALVILFGLYRLLRKLVLSWIVKRLHAEIQHEYDQRLETLKSDLTDQNEQMWRNIEHQFQEKMSFIDSVRSSFTAGQRLGAERKLEAANRLWTEIVKIREVVPPIMLYVDAHKEDETDRYNEFSNSIRQNGLNLNWTPEEFKDKINSISKSMEEVRPYIGEYLWAVFKVYSTVHMRICVKLQFINLNGTESIVNWHNDQMIQDMVSAILDDNEIELFNSQQYGKLRFLRSVLEQKILVELEKFISGEFYLNETQRMLAANALKRVDESASLNEFTPMVKDHDKNQTSS